MTSTVSWRHVIELALQYARSNCKGTFCPPRLTGYAEEELRGHTTLDFAIKSCDAGALLPECLKPKHGPLGMDNWEQDECISVLNAMLEADDE